MTPQRYPDEYVAELLGRLAPLLEADLDPDAGAALDTLVERVVPGLLEQRRRLLAAAADAAPE